MRQEHKSIQVWIKQAYHGCGDVSAEVDAQNKLPDAARHWYQPDVVIRDRNGEIAVIIEVENDPVRKVIVGAAVLADASVAAIEQKRKPRMLFVVYAEQGIKQIPNFREKARIAAAYCKHIESIEVLSEAEFKERRPKL
jgi:hypothetical protein